MVPMSIDPSPITVIEAFIVPIARIVGAFPTYAKAMLGDFRCGCAIRVRNRRCNCA